MASDWLDLAGVEVSLAVSQISMISFRLCALFGFLSSLVYAEIWLLFFLLASFSIGCCDCYFGLLERFRMSGLLAECG